MRRPRSRSEEQIGFVVVAEEGCGGPLQEQRLLAPLAPAGQRGQRRSRVRQHPLRPLAAEGGAEDRHARAKTGRVAVAAPRTALGDLEPALCFSGAALEGVDPAAVQRDAGVAVELL